jgi:hypothetical protein
MQNDINMPCCGCMLFYPNNTTKQLTDIMYNYKSESNNCSINDQIILSQLLRNNSNSIKLHLLDHEMFPNGLLYFNELSNDNTSCYATEGALNTMRSMSQM